jgi:hypothetical protein
MNKMKIKLFLTFLLATLSMHAQWTPLTDVNTEVATSNTDDMKVLGTVNGKTVSVFWKVVGSPVNYELRMQVLNNQGVKQLGPDGVLVSNNMSMSTSTAIMKLAVDQNENVYIGATGTNGGIGFAFKLDINGNHIWGTNGINLGGGYVVTILPLSTGEAVIAWNSSNQTIMQKYSANGTPIWTSTQQVSNGATNGKSPGDLFELSNNEFLLVFHVISFGINSTLWAQKYSSMGLPLWTNPIQLSNKSTVWNTSYSSTQDGNNVYYGYKAATGTHFDSYLQRINPDGTLPWGINGKDFDITTTRNEMDTKIAFSPGSPYVWSICNYTNSAQSTYGVYIQKFDKVTGDRQFTDTAKVIYPIGTWKVNAGDLQIVNGFPVFLLKNGLDNGASPTTLHACKLDANGSFFWPSETEPMGTFLASKKRIHFSKTNNGKVVATFIETKATGGSKIYAQSVSLNTNNTGTAVVTACNSYTWINNVTYTASNNTATYLLTNISGGDSLVTLNLTITPPLQDTVSVNTCDTYSWNGTTYTNSGIYVGPTVNCVTSVLNLTISPSTVHNSSVTECGSYSWNGTTYTISGLYTGPTVNCVTETLDLTITPSTSDTTTATSCDSYTWNGNTFTSSGVYPGPTTNCVTSYLDLSITPSSSDTLFVSACDAYLWNGVNYTSSGVYQGVTSNCVTEFLQLNIDTVDVSTSVSGMTMSANTTVQGTTYQWVDCDANNTPIPGAVNQFFTATDNGNYAVIITQGSCEVMSACVNVSDVGMNENSTLVFTVFPNPSFDQITVQRSQSETGRFSMYDQQGRMVLSGQLEGFNTNISLVSLTAGTYLLKVGGIESPVLLIKN